MRASSLANAERSPMSSGFTLLELLTVLVILAVAMAITLPNLAPNTASSALRADVSVLAGALRLTRQHAILREEKAQFTLDLITSRWTMDPTGESGQLSGRVSITATVDSELAGSQQVGVVFMPDGTATGAEFVLKASAKERIVRVDWLTGKVAVND